VPQNTLLGPFFERQGEFDNKRCVRNRLSLTELGREWKTGISAGPAVGENGLEQPHPSLEMAEKEPVGVLKLSQKGLTMRRSLAVLLLQVACFLLVIQGVASTQDDIEKKRGGPAAPTVLELKFLPPFCTTRFKWSSGQADTEEVKKWENILGGAFIHTHHYCMGLNYLNRIDRGIGNREFLLGLAGGEFLYMQNNVAADNVLRPEVEFNIGMVQYRADRSPQAIGQLLKAIQMKPNYERAYLLLSFCYLRLGDRTSAADALQKGLAMVPDSRALRDALNEMNHVKKEPDGGGLR
jgi:hypothetical protein